MNNNFFRQSILPHLVAVLIFTVLSFAYLMPLLSGDRLAQHDYVQAMGQQHEITSYVEKTGDQALWTNSMFSGMPSIQIWLEYPANLLGEISNFIQKIYIHETYMVFLLLLGFYIMLYPLTKNAWLSVVGSIAFAFGSFNLISLEAGHLNKVWAMAYIAPIIGGLIVAYRGRYLTGAAILAVFLTLQLRANHFQITYYTIIAAVFLGIYFFIEAIKDKQLPVFAKATGILAIAALLAGTANTTQLWGTWDYSKATIRGGKTELTAQKEEGTADGGLTKEYAFSWSYGIGETMTVLLPNFQGGGASQNYEGAAAYDKMYPQYVKGMKQQYGMNQATAEKSAAQQLGSMYYWGSQPFTSGPVYFGVIVCFLFIFGMFIIKSHLKWALLAIAIFSIFLAWGKNFSMLNYALFDMLPMYNKFRTPSMTLALTNVIFVLVGFLALKELLDGTRSKQELVKYLKIAGGITLGLLVAFGFMGSIFMDFRGANDDQLSQMGILQDILSDRQSLLRGDALRGIFFAGISIALIWAFIEQKLKATHMMAALGLLILVDLWTVDKRYFNDADFTTEEEFQKNFKPSQADLAVKQDPDPDYRVLNLNGNPFTDAQTSYQHKSLGGYHAAKLRIYQELIENQLSANIATLNEGFKQGKLVENIPVLNMLNTKYFLLGETADKVVRNPGALGNAWFVSDIKYVNSADEEMASLTGFNPKQTAIVRNTYKDVLGSFAPSADPTAAIQLTSYDPNKLSYTSKSASPQLAVFSEIYYKDGKDWKAYIDGKYVPHIKANYVLRALQIPAGDHKIEFKFEPNFYSTGNIISLVGSLLIFALIGLAVYMEVKARKNEVVVKKA
jgi:hypothetical protein